MENIENAVQKGGEIFLQPVTFLLKMTWRKVGWGRLDGFTCNRKLIPCCPLPPSLLPALFTPSLTSFLHLCSSLLPVFFLFSETDRTRDACESKDERPAWEGYECVWGEWMILLIPQAYIQVKPPCPNTIVKKLRNTFNSIEVWRSVCMFAIYAFNTCNKWSNLRKWDSRDCSKAIYASCPVIHLWRRPLRAPETYTLFIQHLKCW